MTDSRAVQEVLRRIEAKESLNQKDIQTLRDAHRLRMISIATGDRAVSLGGNADGAVIITGDRNFVVNGADAEFIRVWMGKRPWHEKQLLKSVSNQVAARLVQSLHKAVLIQLGKESQPGRVKRPWDSEIKIGDKPAESIPDFITILEVFEKPEIAGKLLILGNPGAGKTTTLLELAQALCNQAEQSAEFPIPVLLNLSNWKDSQQQMQDWLMAELSSQYGIGKLISKPWLRDGKLLLMLDGLDELRSSYQKPCIDAINQLLQSQSRPQHIVICSRDEEYRKHEKTKLQLNGAIYIKPLKDEQIYEYLEQLQRQDLWHVIRNDGILRELVRTPFWLSILILAEPDLEFLDWRQPTTEGRFQALLNAYIRQMMKRSVRRDVEVQGKLPTERQTVDRLVCLAQQMQRESETEFLIEAIQPSWLPERSSWQFIYHLLNRILIGFALALGFTIPIHLSFYESFGIIASIIAALIGFCSGAVTKTKPKIQTIETLKWSWKSFGQGCKDGIGFSLSIAESLLQSRNSRGYFHRDRGIRSRIGELLINKGIFGIVCLILLLPLSMASGILFGLMSGIEGGSNIDEKIIPNQGIRRTATNLWAPRKIRLRKWGILQSRETLKPRSEKGR